MSYRKSTPYTWHAKQGRWRKNGRFASAPPRSQLRRDSIGRVIDGRGRRVPVWAIAPEPKRKKKPVRKPPPKKKVKRAPRPTKKKKPKRVYEEPVYEEERYERRRAPVDTGPVVEHLELAQVRATTIEYHTRMQELGPTEAGLDDLLDPNEYMVSRRHEGRQTISTQTPFFANLLKKGGLEAEDVTILNQGIHIRPADGMITGSNALREIRSLLREHAPEAKIIISTEGRNHEALRIVFPVNGSYMKARDTLGSGHAQLMIDIYRTMGAYFDEVAWDYFIDTDDEVYERRTG